MHAHTHTFRSKALAALLLHLPDVLRAEGLHLRRTHAAEGEAGGRAAATQQASATFAASLGGAQPCVISSDGSSAEDRRAAAALLVPLWRYLCVLGCVDGGHELRATALLGGQHDPPEATPHRHTGVRTDTGGCVRVRASLGACVHAYYHAWRGATTVSGDGEGGLRGPGRRLGA